MGTATDLTEDDEHLLVKMVAEVQAAQADGVKSEGDLLEWVEAHGATFHDVYHEGEPLEEIVEHLHSKEKGDDD